MLTWSLGWSVVAGEVGDHLIGVHVRGRARAGLEDVDRELVVELTGGDAVSRGGDALSLAGVEQAEFGVDARGGGLDASEPADHRHRDRLAGDREVRDGLGGLAAPELLDVQSCSRSSFRCLSLCDERYRARAVEGAMRGPLRR